MEPRDPLAYEFVQRVMRRLEASTARELARALEVAETDGEVTVGRWVRGSSAPNFHGTLRLLHAAGWLDESLADLVRSRRP